MKTEGDVIMQGLRLYWGVGCRQDVKAGLAIIGIITDWREDQKLLALAGQDGAA